jgi:hypothetical protein
VAGLAMAFFWVVVIRGGSKPLVVESICICAEATGDDEYAPPQRNGLSILTRTAFIANGSPPET